MLFMLELQSKPTEQADESPHPPFVLSQVSLLLKFFQFHQHRYNLRRKVLE